MRRKDREVTDRAQIENMLRASSVCRLSMIADGKPYIVPLNFGYTWDDTGLTLYFHTGVEGKKLDALRQNPAVCFEMDGEHGLISGGEQACRYSYAFFSVIGEGEVEFATDNTQKRQGFDVIMQHLTGKANWEYSDAHLSVAEVLRVRVQSVEGSRRLPRTHNAD